ncbi:hypothetical protein AB1L42_06860 [Thalassoglobus sp. JC818]|uniref:GTPase family protein n=1 Tax=Thalassoglobus sp. JC818 TaxID=3232136 RepID=UPI003458B000
MWRPWKSRTKDAEADYEKAREQLLERAPIPVLWLFGKTGSGKSSVVRYLTESDDIEIGPGFRPQTKFSSMYSFPDEDDPILKFLDTRGIGEAEYDPDEDIVAFDKVAHLMIVTIRAMDHAVDDVFRSLSTIRDAVPDRPVLLVLTALHDAYPGEQHPEVDPFSDDRAPLPNDLNPELKRSLELHYKRFDGLFDRAVPIDLTPPHEGFHEPNFGGERLKKAILDSLPAAYRQNLLQMSELLEPVTTLAKEKTMPTILGSSSLAATAAAVPFPWVDIPVVLGIQTHLVYKLASMHNIPIDAATIAQVSGVMGGRVAVTMGIRAGLKFIPWVGMAANSAAAFAFTFATGMAWNWYFTSVAQGHVPKESELKEVFQSQLKRAAHVWRTSQAE